VTFAREVEAPARTGLSDHRAPAPRESIDDDGERFKAMRETLRNGGASVAVSSTLFPTPADLARRAAGLVGSTGMIAKRVLEPSAGTGRLITTALDAAGGFDCGLRVVAVELDSRLAEGLRVQRQKTLYANDSNFRVVCADFLEIDGPDASAGSDPGHDAEPLGLFDVVLMNPPFNGGADIKHILHARRFLKPGGKLVAICANGPRQREQLMPLATHWEDLPAGTFKDAGTNVNTALLMIEG